MDDMSMSVRFSFLFFTWNLWKSYLSSATAGAYNLTIKRIKIG